MNTSLSTASVTEGRSAYQAVFGRLDLLSDSVALASSPADAAIRSEQIRAEALRHLAEFAVDKGIRRALLRKTRATGIADISSQENHVHFGDGDAKVHTSAADGPWDPSHVGSQAWLRTGSTTVLVTAEPVPGTPRALPARRTFTKSSPCKP